MMPPPAHAHHRYSHPNEERTQETPPALRHNFLERQASPHMAQQVYRQGTTPPADHNRQIGQPPPLISKGSQPHKVNMKEGKPHTMGSITQGTPVQAGAGSISMGTPRYPDQRSTTSPHQQSSLRGSITQGTPIEYGRQIQQGMGNTPSIQLLTLCG